VLISSSACPDLTTFCRLHELGLEAVEWGLEPDRAVLECRVVNSDGDRWCRRCGADGSLRDTVTRRLPHEPFEHRPTTRLVRVHGVDEHVWRHTRLGDKYVTVIIDLTPARVSNSCTGWAFCYSRSNRHMHRTPMLSYWNSTPLVTGIPPCSAPRIRT
jgi:transposase